MIKFYQTNQLTVAKIKKYSIDADGGEHGPIPLRDTPDDLKVGDTVDAYVYLDAEDEVVATMATPIAQIGDCAYLKVVSCTDRGTYLYWGLPKDLLLPVSEQTARLREGDSCVVHIFQDERQRPTATMRIHHYLDEDHDELQAGDAVDLLIASESELGFKAIINNEQLGLIHHGELARPLEIGAKMKGWVKKVREDGKINLSISKLDSEARDQLEQTILNQLKESGGRIEVSDKSSPDLIHSTFNVSKKSFKRAIGSLYGQRLIILAPDFIELLPATSTDDKK